MPRYLDPKIDLVFKRIFGEHPDILKSFLNALLPLPEDGLIVELTYLPNEQVPVIPEFKNTITDVKCTDAKGRVFIVEMQIQWTTSFMQRLLYGASTAYVRQIHRNDAYHLLRPVYGIGLIDDIFDKETEEWYHHYQLIHKKDNGKTLDDIQLLFIELPKFNPKTFTEKKLQALWLRFMSEVGEDIREVPPELLEVPEIQKALVLAEEAGYSPVELVWYDKYWDGVRVQRSYIEDAHKIGEEKGKAAGIQAMLKAMDMIKQNYDNETIAQQTGLTSEEIVKTRG